MVCSFLRFQRINNKVNCSLYKKACFKRNYHLAALKTVNKVCPAINIHFYLLFALPTIQGVTSMGKGSGYGKVILFGEHFVVHGVPGIVSAIDSTTDAEVKKAQKGLNVHDERKTAKGYGEEKRLQQIESIERMLKAMNIDPKTPLTSGSAGPARFQRFRRVGSQQRRHRKSHQRRTWP